MRILLVDDEADLLDAVARGLRREGYAVDTAMDGDEALVKAAYTPYDLICLDLTMPGIDGLEVCSTLRADPGAGFPPRILMLTARDTVEDSGAVLEVGDVVLDTARHRARRNDRDLDLTAKEFALLRYFMSRPGEVVSQEVLLDHVWDEHADPFTNTVRVTVGTLRRKLSMDGEEALLETVVGSGYRLLDEDDLR